MPPGPAVDAAGGGGEELKASCTDDKDDENAVEDAVSRPTAAVSDSDHPKESDALSDDPGLWPTVVNDRERCKLVKRAATVRIPKKCKGSALHNCELLYADEKWRKDK